MKLKISSAVDPKWTPSREQDGVDEGRNRPRSTRRTVGEERRKGRG